jgi:hypothetical protein
MVARVADNDACEFSGKTEKAAERLHRGLKHADTNRRQSRSAIVVCRENSPY